MKHISKAYHDFMRFADRNPEYLLCSIIYCTATAYNVGWLFWQLRVAVVVVYIISLFVAFSPISEKLMRMFAYVRRLETAQEKEYLIPIFEAVLSNAREKNNSDLDKSIFDIELFITDSMTVNAFAIGKHTVVITKGAIQAFSEDELRAVFTHEIAHIINADTMALIYTKIGSGIYSLIILQYKLIGWLMSKIESLRPFVRFTDKLFDGITFIFLFLLNICTAIRSRKAERRADNYAITLGYGEDMVSALYTLEKMSLSGDIPLIERLIASHPRTTARIAALENQLNAPEETEEEKPEKPQPNWKKWTIRLTIVVSVLAMLLVFTNDIFNIFGKNNGSETPVQSPQVNQPRQNEPPKIKITTLRMSDIGYNPEAVEGGRNPLLYVYALSKTGETAEQTSDRVAAELGFENSSITVISSPIYCANHNAIAVAMEKTLDEAVALIDANGEAFVYAILGYGKAEVSTLQRLGNGNSETTVITPPDETNAAPRVPGNLSHEERWNNWIRITNNRANRKLSEFGITTVDGSDPYVSPVLNGGEAWRKVNGIVIETRSNGFEVIDQNSDSWIDNIDCVFVPKGSVLEVDYIWVYYITTGGETGLSKLFLVD